MRTLALALTAVLVVGAAGCGVERSASPEVAPETSPDASPDAADPPASIDLESIPLASGYPEDDLAEPGRRYGLAGPSRGLEPMPVWVCGEDLEPTGYDDRLAARWTNVEDFRARELLQFPDAETAGDVAGSLVAAWESCPRHDGGDGFTSVQSVRDLGAGQEGHTLVTWSEYDGAPAIGLTVLQVVRVGEIVLLDLTSNEGGSGAADDQVREQARAAASVVDAICHQTHERC